MGIVNKIIIILLWFITIPILFIMASNKFFYFITNLNDLVLWSILIIAFFIVFTVTLLFGFKEKINDKNLNIKYEENPARRLFELAQKYHLDLEINDALKIYDEIKKNIQIAFMKKKLKLRLIG